MRLDGLITEHTRNQKWNQREIIEEDSSEEEEVEHKKGEGKVNNQEKV